MVQNVAVDVSIVIPTFNRSGPLAEALGSVLSQSMTSLQIIVVDDAPDQTARSVVERFDDPRIRYVANPVPSRGFPSRVRNHGAQFAEGRFVHFLDDDDHVPEGLYEDVVRGFEESPNVGVLFGRVEPFGSNPDQISHEKAFFDDAARSTIILERFGRRWPVATRMMFYSTVLVCGAALIRRECVAGINGFDPNIRYGEDVGFYARAIRKYGGHFLDRTFLHYRIWENSIAHNPALQQATIEDDFKKMQARYLLESGPLDYTLCKIAAKTIMRVL